ncbi:polysaccharide biosynthesis C-terminal domain-containing protein [Ruminococcus sp. Marseille-P6503]|uniref:lipopolysaccharide biosynthesis protein n=1 Tax=Ruminococcus sp. Marseille-P6503 TaxID=2364796 RepID=UPI000F5337C3|nr:polysaccharide biosynthesis C-terminal domain-containing protein [Ruminococcus sp. Marseille-P6503]
MSEATPKQSSYKKLFSNTIIFAIGSFSSKILVLLLVKVYTTYLSPQEMGVNDVITQIANWLQPIVTMTISEAVIRFGLDKAYDKKKVFTLGNIVCLFGLAVLAVILPIVTVSGIADKYLSGYSFLLYVYIFMSSLKLVYSTFVRSIEKVKLFAVNGILTTLFTLFGTILFICGFKMGNTGYLLSIIVSDFISIIFLTFAAKLWRYIDFKKPDRELLHTMLRYSVPLIPAQLLWLITNSSDSFMTTHYLGSEANGILSASYKIPNLVATVYLMFGQAWNMSAIMENDSDDRNEFYDNVFKLNQCLLYIMAAGCLLIVQPLTGIWLGDAFQDSVKYSPILIYSSVFSCFTTFMGSIYLASKQTKRSLVTSLFSGIINVALNIVLIPRIGLYGPAISTVASYVTVFIIRAYDSRKLVPFDLHIGKIIVNNILLIAMVLINVFQFIYGYKTLSLIALPILFLIVFLLNFRTLWKAAERLLPAGIAKKLHRLGAKRITVLCIALCVFAAIVYLTNGIILYPIAAAAVIAGLLINRKSAVYAGISLVFLTSWGIFGIETAVAAASLCLLVPLVIYRRNTELIVCTAAADILLFIIGGIYLAVFCLMIELLAAIVIFRKQLYHALEKIMFK